MTIYIDMDETVYNLSELVIDIANKELGMNFDYTKNEDWWWQTTGVPREYFENLLQREGIFYEGLAIRNSLYIIDTLYHEGYDIKFLSTPQWNSKYCVCEKVQWLSKYFNWFDPNIHLILTGDKSIFDKEGDILIDDAIHNLTWTKGLNIAFKQNWNKNYQGLRMDWEEIYDFIHNELKEEN